MYKILVADADLSFYKDYFPSFTMDFAYSEDEILDLTFKNRYDLFIVNIYYFNLLKELQDSFENETPIIFVDEYYEISRLKKALSVGDECMIKPILVEELQIRVNYFFRKLFKHKGNILAYKNFYYHLNSKQLFLKNEKVKLSPNEIKLVELFILYKDKPLTKETIYETINTQSNGTLRVYISKLNKVGLNIDYERSNSTYSLI